MRILLTNDDGITAPGLEILSRISAAFTDDIWVVAPETEQSGAAHSLSLRKPLYIRDVSSRHFAVNGTPTDCVLLALKEILRHDKPDFVFSGINRGGNLGEDITYSGTVAAAMEATLLGVPALAFSQVCNDIISWEVALRYSPQLIAHITTLEFPPHTLFNINFPACQVEKVKGIKVVPQGKRKIGDNIDTEYDESGQKYYRIGNMRNYEKDPPLSDFATINAGYITCTPLYLDLTHYGILETFDELLSTEF